MLYPGLGNDPGHAVAKRQMSGGFAPRALLALREWRKQFQVPLLSLTPVDTIKSLVLDPARLATVKRATELKTRADSLRDALTSGVRAIPFAETVDFQ